MIYLTNVINYEEYFKSDFADLIIILCFYFQLI